MMVRPLAIAAFFLGKISLSFRRLRMGHIGAIIEKYRQASGMSRKELSEDICSEKHIYLIENGERAPSVNLLKLLGDKLGVNLFEFYPYLSCEDPFAVREKIDQFIIHRINFDFDSLKKISTDAENMPDFKNKPWSFEIYLNCLYCMVYGERRFEKSLPELEKILKETESDYTGELFKANIYAMISVCHIFTGNKKNAKDAALAAYGIFTGKQKIEMYNQFTNRIIVNVMAAYYFNGEYDDVIAMGNDVLNIKENKDSYARIHFIYFFMALSYYVKEMREKATEFLKKAIYFLMSYYKPTDVSYVAMYGRFHEMLEDLGSDSEIICEFKEKYRL